MAQLSLGQVIDALEGVADRGKRVHFDFPCAAPTTINSSRGFYEHPALGWGATGYSGPIREPTVVELLAELNRALVNEYRGWKGGDFNYDRSSPLWVDNPGDWSGTYICGVEDDGYSVTLLTEREKD